MITKLYDKNKFGGSSYQIKIDTFWRIDIHETNNCSYIIELKEIGIFSNRLHFSNLTNSKLENTIIEAFNKVYDYFLLQKKFTWSLEQKTETQKDALFSLKQYFD